MLILWNVRISMRQKLALGGIFGLTVLIIIAAILRVSFTTNKNRVDASWLYFWNALELTIGM